MSRKRNYTVHDQELWEAVAKLVTPIGSPHKKQTAKTAPPAVTRKVLPVKTATGLAVPAAPAVTPQPKRPTGPPPLASFDRRTSQKMLRGQADIDARLDLHGLSLEMARFHLLDFLAARRARGARLILVITGKGASPFSSHTLHGQAHFDTPEREGKIRRAFPRWLEEAAFRAHVIGFQPAHPRHGGGGAFYVRLRKPE